MSTCFVMAATTLVRIPREFELEGDEAVMRPIPQAEVVACSIPTPC